MPFNLKQFLKKIDKTVAPKVESALIPEPVVEPVQDIIIPEYVPIEEPDSEPDVNVIVPKKRKVKNKDIVRKVPLNPLSDL
jgi:hypothetical protein